MERDFSFRLLCCFVSVNLVILWGFFGDMSVGDGDFLWGNVGVRGGVEGTWEKGEDGPSLSFPLSIPFPIPLLIPSKSRSELYRPRKIDSANYWRNEDGTCRSGK